VCEALRIDLSDLLAEVWRVLVAQRSNVVPLRAARFDIARPPGPAGRGGPHIGGPHIGGPQIDGLQIGGPQAGRRGEVVLLAA
jgi:hypothetical protein